MPTLQRQLGELFGDEQERLRLTLREQCSRDSPIFLAAAETVLHEPYRNARTF